MKHIAIKDLKKTKELHASLAKEHEVSVRRALFATAVSSIREKSSQYSITYDEISEEIKQSRKERGIRES